MDTNTPTPSAEKDHFLPISILVAAILISGSLIYTTRIAPSGGPKQEPAPAAAGTGGTAAGVTANVSDLLPRDVVIGDTKAPITLIEYGDYQCPFCGRWYAQTEKQIRDNYIKTGKVRFIYRDFAFLGDESVAAAQAAECSKDQGKFAAYHDALFDTEQADGKENNGDMTRDLFIKLAGRVGADIAKFTDCYDKKTYADVVTTTHQNGTAVGVQGTPATFVNGKEALDTNGGGGALPYSAYVTIFDAILAGKK